MASCCSINMRIFKTTELMLLLFFIICSSNAAPGRAPHALNSQIDSQASKESDESSESSDHYDQRQNGTENYRIHVDGLVVVVAPVEALLLAGGIPGATDSNIFGIQQGDIIEKPSKPEEPAQPRPKPEAEPEAIKDKPLDAKSSHRHSLRLMSLLSPFLRKVHSHH